MEFQSTKGTVEASFPVPQLTIDYPPAFQFCQVLRVGDKKWETARTQVGGRKNNQRGGP